MKCEEARRLKSSEKKHRRLNQFVADHALHAQMLDHLWEGTGEPF